MFFFFLLAGSTSATCDYGSEHTAGCTSAGNGINMYCRICYHTRDVARLNEDKNFFLRTYVERKTSRAKTIKVMDNG